MSGNKVSAIARIYRRIPIFIISLFSHLMIIVICFVFLLVLKSQSSSIAKRNYLDQRQYSLNACSESFMRQLEEFRSIPSIFANTVEYRKMRLTDHAKFDNSLYYYSGVLKRNFSLQCAQISICNDAFIYFYNNNTIITNKTFNINGTEYVSKYIFSEIAGDDLPGFLDLMSPDSIKNGHVFCPSLTLDGISVKNGNYIAYLYRVQNESALFCMLINEPALIELFRIEELPPGTSLHMKENGTDIFTYSVDHAASEDYEVLTWENDRLGFSVRLNIPSQYFTDLSSSLDRLNAFYIIIALCISLLLSLLFSHLNQKPIRNMIKALPGSSENQPIKNELLILDEGINQSLQDNMNLQGQINSHIELLRINILSRVLSQETQNIEDESLVYDYLPEIRDSVHIVCVQFIPDKETENTAINDYMIRMTGKYLGSIGYIVQMKPAQFALLVKSSSEILSTLTNALSDMQNELDTWNTIISVGMSESINTPSMLHNAYTHAIFAQCNYHAPISVFESTENHMPFDFSEINRFQNAVINCDKALSQSILYQLLSSSRHLPWVEQAIRYILESVCIDMKITDVPATTVQKYTDAVIDTLSKRKDSYTSSMFEAVIDYLYKNHSDPSLSVESVAKNFRMSKSYLYRLFKEQSAVGFSEKLESIRLEHATTLLLTTHMSVNDIAATCGYSLVNTFYRAYRRVYGNSPVNTTRKSNGAQDTVKDEDMDENNTKQE